MKKIYLLQYFLLLVFAVKSQSINLSTPSSFGSGYNLTISLSHPTAINEWEFQLEQTVGVVNSVLYATINGANVSGAPYINTSGNIITINNRGLNYGAISAGGTIQVVIRVMSTEVNPAVKWNYFPNPSTVNGSGVAFRLIASSQMWENAGKDNYGETTADLNQLKLGTKTGIGTAPSENVQLLVENKSSDVEAHGIKTKMHNDSAKAFSVENVSSGKESFMVYGNGTTRIGGPVKFNAKFSIRGVQSNVLACSEKDTSSVFWAKNPLYAYGFGIGNDHKGHLFQDINNTKTVMTFDKGNVSVDAGEFSIHDPSLTNNINTFRIVTKGANTANVTFISGTGYSDLNHINKRYPNQLVSNLRFLSNGGLEFTNRLDKKDKFIIDGEGKFNVYNDFMVRQNDTINFKVKSNGYVYAREINVQTSTFPDYVFKSDYDLINLTELADYIAKNGHLPNVPSEEEVVKKGISLGELAKLQMEKIEELTLYTLSQQESIEAQKKLIIQLAARLAQLECKSNL